MLENYKWSADYGLQEVIHNWIIFNIHIPHLDRPGNQIPVKPLLQGIKKGHEALPTGNSEASILDTRRKSGHLFLYTLRQVIVLDKIVNCCKKLSAKQIYPLIAHLKILGIKPFLIQIGTSIEFDLNPG